MEKILTVVTAIGAMFIVVAVVFFSLTGSGLPGDLILYAAGSLTGMLLVSLLVRSSLHGRLIAVSMLAFLVAGCLALLLVAQGSLVTFVEDHRDWSRFLSGLVGATGGISLLRLFGLNLLGPRRGDRESQPSRRRS